MGKGRDKRRRKTKGKEEVRIAKGEPLNGEPFGPFDPHAPVFTLLKPKPSSVPAASLCLNRKIRIFSFRSDRRDCQNRAASP
jgi:hypothetical protein